MPSRSHTWTPDVLGNWVGDPNDPNYPFGLQVYIDADGNGQSEAWITTVHDVNPANQITQITKDDSQVGDWVRQPVYDRAGNLVWDGRFYFQYDGFSRLVQVYYAVNLQPACFDSEGRLGSAYGNLLGAKVAAFTYDGLGRLIRTERWRSGGASQVEDYYYDGARRIQEVETTVGGPSPGTVTREYVWGPGYADEIVCQFDYSADPLGGTGVEPETYYYLQDANYNVVAVVAPASGPNSPAVLWQYTYGPYGDVLAADAHPTLPLPVNRIGHQGLFFERLTTGSVATPMLAVGARGLYNSRNRWLHVELGRFVTRDPAEAAMPIITALAFNGDSIAGGTPTLPFSPTGHYADGFNLYEFVGSNPVNRSDPLGLQWGIDDDIDDLVNDLTGHKLYALGAMNEGAKWASLGLNTALNIAGALLGIDVFQSACLIWSGQGGFWEGLDIVMSLNPVGRLGKVGAVLGKVFKWKNAAKAGKYLGKMIGHHTVPKAVLDKLSPSVRNAGPVRGMAGQRNIWQIPEDLHKQLHGGGPRGGRWNKDWWDELDALGGPERATVEQVVEIRAKLVSRYGLEEFRP